MPQTFAQLRRARHIGTVSENIVGRMIDGRTAYGAAGRKRVNGRTPGPQFENGIRDVGDNVARRRTTTVSPLRMSLRTISASLCNVAILTTTPPIVTGSKTA